MGDRKLLRQKIIRYFIAVILCLVLVLLLLAIFEMFKFHNLDITVDILLATVKDRFLHPVQTIRNYIETQHIGFFVGLAFSVLYPLYVSLHKKRNVNTKDKNSQSHGTARLSTLQEILQGNNFLVKTQAQTGNDFENSLVCTKADPGYPRTD